MCLIFLFLFFKLNLSFAYILRFLILCFMGFLCVCVFLHMCAYMFMYMCVYICVCFSFSFFGFLVYFLKREKKAWSWR